MKTLPFFYLKSLRLFLVVSISLCIVIIGTATVSLSYYTINKNTASFFDVLLIESAEKLKVFLRAGDISSKKLKEIQSELNQCGIESKCNIDPIINTISDPSAPIRKWTTGFIERYRTESVFQVWHLEPENLILYSKFAPSEDFAEFIPGFQTVEYQGYKWRVYTQIKPKLNIAIQTAQREDLRNDLAEMILKEQIMPFLIFTPLLLILIFIAIKITADTIKHITKAIKTRDPKNLSSLTLEKTPIEIRPLIAELNRLFILINQSFEREQRFNSDAAHELKTPLAAIKSHTEVARRAIEKSNYQQALDNLNDIIIGVDRSSHLVSQLLLLSRLSPNMPLDHIEPCHIDKITRQVIADSINKAIDKDIEISQDIIFNYGCSAVPTINGNHSLLHAMARNIIDNAIRYSGKNTEITVKIIVNLTKLTLQVCDTGPGLSDELKTRVFDRFYRQPGTNTKGSGLGLSIVKLIAELHNADIKLTDNKKAGHGLCFEVIFKPSYVSQIEEC